MDTDVLIVGAGPTGLMLANQLARRGVHALIVDRHSGPAQQSRAMAVHARTLEIYSRLGISGRALDLGKRGNGANMWSGGRKRARIPLGDIGRSVSPFPYVLMLGQDDNERILGDHLRTLGVSVQWNTELTALQQEPGQVTATLRQPDGTSRKVMAAYVAGCDGGRSAVRELSGITFPGAPYEHVFFVADTEAAGPMVPDELNVYLWRDGFHLFFPMRGTDRWRVIGILPGRMSERDDLTFEEVVPAIRGEAGADLSFKSCFWFSTYRIHHRCAARFRDRRCFLLGDAAHVHSPMGGQGMNTGLQDAYNLAWKLALVVSGRADAALLDSYEEERIPVAQRLLATTDRAFRLLVSDAWIAGIFRTSLFPRLAAFAMTQEPARQLAFRTLSQTGICYPDSPLSQTLADLPGGAPRAGDRFPWLTLKFQGGGMSGGAGAPVSGDAPRPRSPERWCGTGRGAAASLALLLAGAARCSRTLLRTPSRSGTREGRSAADAKNSVSQLRNRGGGAEDLFERLDDTRFNLVAIGQRADAVEAGYGDLLRVHGVADDPGNAKELARVQITAPAFYLLRPDGHVGLCGGRLEAGAVHRYFFGHRIALAGVKPE